MIAARERWSGPNIAALGFVLVLGVAIRLVLLPTRGFADDIDQFIGWVRHIAIHGLGTLYGETDAGPVTFGPVMAYIWGLLAAVEPLFRTATDGSDPGISAIMKLPASIADVGVALLVVYFLRHRPRLATIGAALILLHPAVIDVSAWWGQYESIYALTALAAVIFAVHGRNNWAAVAVALSLLTKPQALAFILPFAAWFWATGGWRGLARATAIGAAVMLVLWLPFVPANGPLNYLRHLGEYQSETFNVLSLRAWNAWWLVQEAVASGAFIRDDAAIIGPVTLRHVGYGIAGLLSLTIASAIMRRPTPRSLILGLTASVLVFFTFATQMHERYAYAAVVLLALLVAEPGARLLSLVLGVVFTLNLLAAIPPTPEIGALLPVSGALGILGSVGFVAITYTSLRLAAHPPDHDQAQPPQVPTASEPAFGSARSN